MAIEYFEKHKKMQFILLDTSQICRCSLQSIIFQTKRKKFFLKPKLGVSKQTNYNDQPVSKMIIRMPQNLNLTIITSIDS